MGWAALLFVLSALPDLPGPIGPSFGDKLGHFVLYAVFGITLAWGRVRAPVPIAHVVLIAIGAIYGITDEWHQLYVPGRTPDPADWLADIAGLVTGYFAATSFLDPLPQNESEESA